MPDNINRPAHYVRSNIEPIKVTEAWHLGFHLGNVIKYIDNFCYIWYNKIDQMEYCPNKFQTDRSVHLIERE